MDGYAAERATGVGQLSARLLERIWADLPPADAAQCCETLARVCGNVLRDPTERKYWTLRKASSVVARTLCRHGAAKDLLQLVGFEELDDRFALQPDFDLQAMGTVLADVQESLLGHGGSGNAGTGTSTAASRMAAAPASPQGAKGPAGTGAPEVEGSAGAAAASVAAATASAADTAESTAVASTATAATADAAGAAAVAAAATLAPAHLIVRLCTQAGRSRLKLSPHATFGELQESIRAAVGVDPEAQRLSFDSGSGQPSAPEGLWASIFGPSDQRPLLQGTPDQRLATLGIESGTSLHLLNPEATIVPQHLSQQLAVGPALEVAKLRTLPGEQVDRYWADGVIGPLDGVEGQAAECLAGFGRLVAHSRGNLGKRAFHSHVMAPWLYDLACHPAIAGAVASVLRTDTVLLYNSVTAVRSPGKTLMDEAGIGWHADGGGFRPLQPQRDFVTAFVALTPCRRENGCLEFERQSDRGRFLMELQPGQFSLHSASVQHNAIRNTTDTYRICVVFRYISGRVRDVAADPAAGEERDWAIHVSGRDGEGSFRPVPRPKKECDADGHELWEAMRVLRERRYGRLV